MSTQVLFIQGGGEDGYNADKAMVDSLKNHLGKEYEVHYNAIETNETLPDYGFTNDIMKQMAEMNDGFILAGHSLGASMILKCLSEQSIYKTIKGIFLLSTPYWDGDEDWKAALKLREDFARYLPASTPLFFYQCRDDEEVSIEQFEKYKAKLAGANFLEIEKGGHQLDNDLAAVAQDIKKITW